MVGPKMKNAGAEQFDRSAVASSSRYRPRDRWRFMKSPPDRAMKSVPLALVTRAVQSRALLVGPRRDVRIMIRCLGQSAWSGPPIIGYVDAGNGQERASSMRPHCRHFALHSQTDPVPVLGSIDRIDELVDVTRATHLVVAVSGKSGPRVRSQLSQLIKSGVIVHWVLVDSGRIDLAWPNAPASSPTWSLHSASPPRPNFEAIRWQAVHYGRLAKRAIDIAVAALALFLLAPLFAVVALSILVTTGRPIFYSQVRVGQGGKQFRIIKFRSMSRDAESATGPIWASDHDKRCTRIGDWLRHTNIDELPQFWNVLRGDMSLVGPRPNVLASSNSFAGPSPTTTCVMPFQAE